MNNKVTFSHNKRIFAHFFLFCIATLLATTALALFHKSAKAQGSAETSTQQISARVTTTHTGGEVPDGWPLKPMTTVPGGHYIIVRPDTIERINENLLAHLNTSNVPLERDDDPNFGIDSLTAPVDVSLGLLWYYAEGQVMQTLITSTEHLESDTQYALPLNMTANQPGGQYYLYLCQLQDCSVESIVKQLSSSEGTPSLGLSVQPFKLPPLAEVKSFAIPSVAVDYLSASIAVNKSLSSSDVITAEWYRNGQPLNLASNPSLNILQPYQHFDPETEQLRLYPSGELLKSYLESYAPEWLAAFPDLNNVGLDLGTYELKVLVNNYVEDVKETEVETTSP